MITQLSHWRIASAAAVFVLAGSSAVVIAMHNEPSSAYQANAVRTTRRSPVAPTPADRSGRALLAQAVAACRSTAFSGVQVFRFWGPAGLRVWRTEIWHRPDGQTEAAPVPGGDTPPVPGQADTAPGPSVSVALSSQQLALLQASYVLEYAGHGVADGRPAELVTVDRPDGAVAAKYWLDGKTRLPLRRQLFDDHARLVSDITVAGLRTGKGSLAGMPAGGSQPWPRELSPAALTALRTEGWPLPAQLPGGMILFAASTTGTAAGEIVAVSYSDGLSDISIFVQRGRLSARMPGWQRIAIAGHDAYAVDPDDQTIAWSGAGYVFTLLADASDTAVGQAIAALPQGAEPGLWNRLARGFSRLASWANPFR